MFFYTLSYFFTSELNGRSKELSVQLINDGKPPESKFNSECYLMFLCVYFKSSAIKLLCFDPKRICSIFFLSSSGSLLGQLCVPLDLVKKHPKGQQTFALRTKDSVAGSLTAEVGPSAWLAVMASGTPLVSAALTKRYVFDLKIHLRSFFPPKVYLPGTQRGEVLAPSHSCCQKEGGNGPYGDALWDGGHHHHCGEEQARTTTPTQPYRYNTETTQDELYVITQDC